MTTTVADLSGVDLRLREYLAQFIWGVNAGAPSSGTSGTGAGYAPKGALLIDSTNGKVYINTNTVASPTWNDVANVTSAEIGTGAVDTTQLADGAVTNVKVDAAAAIARSKLAQDALKPYKIPLTDFLAEDGAELGIVEDAADLYRSLSSNVVSLLGRTPQSATEAAAATAQFSLPAEYDAGETVTVRVTAQFINGAGADAGRASTVDVEVYEQADGAVGADLVTTAAQVFTADDTYETFDFTVTPTNLVAGDLINVVVTASAVADDANPTQIQIGEVAVLCDVKG